MISTFTKEFFPLTSNASAVSTLGVMWRPVMWFSHFLLIRFRTDTLSAVSCRLDSARRPESSSPKTCSSGIERLSAGLWGWLCGCASVWDVCWFGPEQKRTAAAACGTRTSAGNKHTSSSHRQPPQRIKQRYFLNKHPSRPYKPGYRCVSRR